MEEVLVIDTIKDEEKRHRYFEIMSKKALSEEEERFLDQLEWELGFQLARPYELDDVDDETLFDENGVFLGEPEENELKEESK